jgi:hypothetical protein
VQWNHLKMLGSEEGCFQLSFVSTRDRTPTPREEQVVNCIESPNRNGRGGCHWGFCSIIRKIEEGSISSKPWPHESRISGETESEEERG